ncbi:uncharacterized protein ATNIH1004_001888 [Aspergillus tanneri]|uniref:Uncharacterized protein n=1 Tax=Aspergillus tanneri TaxID=1220188 RepID=A0A5M9M927_9EURO|nr:uncharacterized protein ATNIH1004_001888 [Aspergillus tanneri]KAA8641423.1 hypothetical protein ATNIH1004_001888 [Aspergillus tanneri]
MQSINPTTRELPVSDSGSEASKWSLPLYETLLLPLYHMDQDQEAGPLNIQLFQTKRNTVAKNSTQNSCPAVRRFNIANGLNAELGTIDVGVLLQAWDDQGIGGQLDQFESYVAAS